MPFVERPGARVHWEALGRGEPVVLIMGLGCSSALWFRVAAPLAQRQRVILLDNRGVGRTQVDHFVVHRIATMAADVAAVLDAAGAASAHVVGFSMGGMIAQQFALDFPHRVRSLLLLATHCGGRHATHAEPHVLRLLFARTEMAAEDSLRALRPYTYAAATPEERIAEDALLRLADQPTSRGYMAQLLGLVGWSSYWSLPRLRCPTLVLHGLQDRLIPPANGRLLAERIPNARLVEFEDASHWLTTDQTERSLQVITQFIRDNTP